MKNCKNCGHEITEISDNGKNKRLFHSGGQVYSQVCNESVKANKKIRQKKRGTEPIKYLPCGCTNPEFNKLK